MTESELSHMPWFKELVAEVQTAIQETTKQNQDQTPALENEVRELYDNISGWSQSLAKRDLPETLRFHIEQQSGAALQRIEDVNQRIQERATALQDAHVITDPAQVAEHLNRLAEILAGNNPSRGNIELAHHIDRIDCYSDGKVVVRACKLGALAGAIDLLKEDGPPASGNNNGKANDGKVIPRRLTRRRVDSVEAPTEEFKSRAIWATDPNRFAGLDHRWFEEHVFEPPQRLSWAEQYALAVAAERKLGKTEEVIAAQFEKSVPTIRNALRIARKSDPELRSLPRRMPRGRWHEEHAMEVWEKKKAGVKTKELVKLYGKSDTTIRAAVNFAKQLANGGAGERHPKEVLLDKCGIQAG